MTLRTLLILSLTFCLVAGTPKPVKTLDGGIAHTAPPVFDVHELNPAINPTQNLNGFVNSKWIASTAIPADYPSWGSGAMLVEDGLKTQRGILEGLGTNAADAKPGSIEQKLAWLYQSGMDEAAIEKAGADPIRPQLAEIEALRTPGDVASYLGRTFASGSSAVFVFYVSADVKEARRQIAYANQGGLGLPTKDYYTDAKFEPIRKAYLAYITKSFQLVGIPESDAKAQADSVMAFEAKLAKASFTPTEQRDVDRNYHFMSFKEADKVMPHFNWEVFFKAQGAPLGDGFSLCQPDFFKEVDGLIASAPMAQWQAYLRFHAIDSAAPSLSKAFLDNAFEFKKALTGQAADLPRWKRVTYAVDGSMGQALGQLYVAKMFTAEAKRRAEELVANVMAALKEHIEAVDWMSPETKAKALAKLGKILPKIGYPDHWRDWSGLKIVPGNYFGNLMAAQKFNYDFNISHLGHPTDRTEWFMDPQTVDAYYDPSTNTINFPAAILQPPIFYANGDDAINYGGIGAVIGHEASHGFDDQGCLFDGDGNRKNWWTKADKDQFDARTGKLVAQIEAFHPLKKKPELHENGKLTLGENIADLGGLSISYDALQMALKKNPAEAKQKLDGFTQDQRFFLSWARIWRSKEREAYSEWRLNTDPHSLDMVRADAAPSNMPSFAKAFGAKPGDAMALPKDQRVKIW